MKKLLIVLVLVFSAYMPITAKAQAQASITPFHFVFTADSRDDYTVLPVFSHKMVTLNPAFGLFGGDLCGSFDVNCINNTWKPALDGNNSDGMLAKTFVSRGNHDNGSVTTWQGLWDFQSMAAAVGAANYTALVSDATYSFDYSNSHFSVIDLPGGGSSSWTSAEISWLDADLTAAEGRGVKHEFIFAHGPMYGVTSQHGSETPSAALKAVLNKHPISAGFHGHEHVTAYTDVTPSREAGINNYQQFTLGRAGAPAYTVAKPVDWSANQNAFADVFVNGNDFTVTIYGQSGSALFTKTFTDSAGTPVPATSTTVPPTATNVPPSATAVPPTGTNVPPTAATSAATVTQTVVPPTLTNTTLPGNTATSTNPATATKPSAATSTPSGSLSFPLRLAFYYPWFPEAWNQLGISPYTNYHPSLGSYDSSNQTTIKTHIAAMQYGGIQGGIASWWGQGSATDGRIPALLQGAAGTAWQWSIYYEPESLGDPSVAQLASDLTYLHDHYAGNPNFLKIGGRFVVFVYADSNDGCGMADRWKQANTVNAYVVLKVFAGYKSCASQPDGWHQYSPAVAANSQAGYSYAISPGFWKAGESARLARDLTTWNTDIRNMIASNAPFQLVTTFNEWGEGTSIESASEWNSPSGYGAYLDALHNNGQALPLPSSTPVATATMIPSSTPTPSPAPTIVPTLVLPSATSTATTALASPTSSTSATTRFLPSADAYTDISNPTVNTGSLTQLRIDNSPVVNGYLRFDVQGLSGSVTKATLRVYANSSSSAGYQVYQVPDASWSEITLTYNNAPPFGNQAGSMGAFSGGAWTTADVTSMISGNGTFSFALTDKNNTAISFVSREGGANAPQLEITVNGAVPSPSSTPAATETMSPTSTPTPAFTFTSVPMNTVTATAIATATGTPAAASPTSSVSVIMEFSPSADAYADASNPTVNTGSSTQIRIDNSPVVHGYLRFDVQGLSGSVTKATLRVYANSSSSAGYQVYQVPDTSWSETTITYNNAPALGGMVGSMAAFSGGAWTTVDVTSVINGNGTFSLGLTDKNNTAISFVSREGGANAPQLEITVNGAVPSPTISPSLTPTATEMMIPTTSPSSTPTATQAMSPTNTPAPAITSTPVLTNTPTATAPATATATQVAVASPTSSVSTIMQFSPSADSYTDASSPNTNKGTSTQIRIDNSPVVNSYLRFEVQGLNGSVTSAILRVYANSSSSAGYQLYRIPDTSWGETTLTYNNAPPFGSQAGSMAAFSAGTWTSVDVTPLITGNGAYSFALTGKSSTAVSLASRESGANGPQLVITVGGTGTSPTVMPPSITPTSTHAAGPTATQTPPIHFHTHSKH